MSYPWKYNVISIKKFDYSWFVKRKTREPSKGEKFPTYLYYLQMLGGFESPRGISVFHVYIYVFVVNF